ncbi:MAG: DegT/DnrJ/EryC1/StrS family aminotransferase, partial [Pseudomonadota bacterium]
AELDAGLAGLEGLTTPEVAEDCTHVYYVYGMALNTKALGVSRAVIADALRAEGVPGVAPGYQNLHRLPIFTERIAYGTGGFPWTLRPDRNFAYGAGTCPVAEELQDESFLGLAVCLHQLPSDDVADVVTAFRKVWANLGALKD